MILRTLIEQVEKIEPPAFGSVKLAVDMHYSEGERTKSQVSACSVETLKG